MKNKFLRYALGTTVLTFLFPGAALSEDPVVDTRSPVTSISGEEIERIPTSRDPLSLLHLAPGTLSNQLSTTPRISYDSKICQNYGSGSLFLPDNNAYDPRLVDEAMGYIDNLSDKEFLDFMDWLDGAGPPPFTLRNSNLGRAMDAVDWMTDEEIDEIFRLTEERDDALFFGENPRLKISFSGIFAQALVPKPSLGGLGPRYATTLPSGGTTPPSYPTFTAQQGLTEADLQKLKDYFNNTGSVTVPPEKGGDWSAYVPRSSLYNYDRFQLKAAYDYSLDNNITDSRLPTVEFSPDYNTPYLDELTQKFEQALTEDLEASLTGFYNKPNVRIELDMPSDVDVQLQDTDLQIPITPSSLRFWRPEKGGMTQIDPPTTEITPVEPVESVIPELADPFRIEGHLGSEADEVFSDWESISPRIGLSYDIGPGVTLRIPLGAYQQPSTTTTKTDETPNNIYDGKIQFKAERAVFENDQSNIIPAEETIVKLGFPIPPMPLEGNPRIDVGASDDPVQGEVDAATGTIRLDYKLKDAFGLRLGASYDYGALDDTEIGDGSPPTLTMDEPDTSGDATGGDSGEGWSYDPDMVRIRLDFGGGMTRIDPPTLDLEAGPSDEPIDSVMDDLQPYSLGDPPAEPIDSVMDDLQPYSLGDPPAEPIDSVMDDLEPYSLADSDEPATTATPDQEGGDSRLQGRQSDIDWNAVQNALGEFADIPALDRMRNRDKQFEGGDTSPGTESGETTPSIDASSFDWESISPRIGLTYDIGGDRSIKIRSGIRDTVSDVELDINMEPMDSKIIFSDEPLGASFGFLDPRAFQLYNDRVTAIFFPESAEPKVNDLIENTPGIKRADPNPYRDKQGDDPYFTSKGSWGQDYADQWAIQRVGFSADELSAWAAAGEDLEPVIVAVIDSGIDWNHADITWDRIWNNEDEIPNNGVDDDGNGYVDDVIGWDFFYNTNMPWDEDGHGTFVAGIIAAESDNGIGISGINPAAKIMVLKALDNFGHTRASYLAEAIKYAVDNGARVINLSVGGREVTFAEELAVKYAEDHGVLVFAAAGNQGQETSDYGFVPYDSVVAVGSTGIEDKRSRFSNWGKDIDITAPGEDILSLRARRTDLMLNIQGIDYEMGAAYVGDDKRYYRAAGTSFSTPIVAGVASLILSKNPGLTADEVRRMILQSARDIEVPGRDQFSGFGLLDATAALTADPDFEITADISGVEVIQDKGQVLVKVNGMVSANQFKSAVVEIGAGENPASWTRTGDIKKPVSGGELARIPAAFFQGSKVWIIRVIVTHRNGQTREQRYTLTLG